METIKVAFTKPNTLIIIINKDNYRLNILGKITIYFLKKRKTNSFIYKIDWLKKATNSF